jgi:hypothetical protein
VTWRWELDHITTWDDRLTYPGSSFPVPRDLARVPGCCCGAPYSPDPWAHAGTCPGQVWLLGNGEARYPVPPSVTAAELARLMDAWAEHLRYRPVQFTIVTAEPCRHRREPDREPPGVTDRYAPPRWLAVLVMTAVAVTIVMALALGLFALARAVGI